MNRWMTRVFKVVASAVFTVGMVGCIMHALMPHAHPPAASEFGMGPRRSVGGAYTASLIPEGELVVRKLQTVRVAVADSTGYPVDGAAIVVDGGMPQHGHGLPTQPRVTQALGNGEYLVEGLRFNMGGWWEIKLLMDGALGPDTVTFNLDL
jgi:hypothetical protein